MTAPMTLTVDDRELLDRLRTMCSHRGDGIATQFVNPDGPEAADRIEALDAECERAWSAYRIAHNQAMSNGQALSEARAALIQTEVP